MSIAKTIDGVDGAILIDNTGAVVLGAGGVLRGHRYWQLAISVTSAGNLASIAEAQFRTKAGVPLLFSGGTAFASSTYDTPYVPSMAVDNDPSTRWTSYNIPPQTWGYDYGAGKALNIVEIYLQARDDGNFALTPAVFTPQWSDDGTNWTSVAQITTAPWTSNGQIQTFPVTAPTHSPQALAYLARTVGGNEGGNGANIANLIDGLVSDGVWSKLDAFYVLAQQNQADALLNLVGTSYTITAIGPPIFTAYAGFGPFGGSQYLNTTFNAASAPSPQYTQNSASYGVWSYAIVDENLAVMGNGGGGSSSIMYPSFPSASFYARVNDGSGGAVPTPGTKGLFVGDRSTSTNVIPYWNGTAQSTLASTSGAIVNASFTIGQSQGFLAQDNPAPRVGTTQTLSAAFIGASLGSAGQLALYNRLNTYMTAVGINSRE